MKIIFTIQITATACVCLFPLLPARLLPSNEQWILWLENKNNIVEKVSLQATPLDSLLWKGGEQGRVLLVEGEGRRR